MEFEWHIFPGLASLEMFQKTKKDLQDQNIELEHFEGRIICISMFNVIDWTKRGNSEKCMYFEFRRSQELREEVLARTLDFCWPRR